jgi:hypothetical protein
MHGKQEKDGPNAGNNLGGKIVSRSEVEVKKFPQRKQGGCT